MDVQHGGAFATAAKALWEAGLCPIPCGGDDGKRPLVATKRWAHRPPRQRVQGWANDPRFQSANVGILTGMSRLTILDIDAPHQVPTLQDLFGATPIIVGTPSGGRHLWYRASGEPSANLRPQGFAADIKGVGGFVVVPPSTRSGGSGCYRFLVGTLADVGRLPAIAPGGVRLLNLRRSIEVDAGQKIGRGKRNIEMFREARLLASTSESEAEVVDELKALDAIMCDPPLPDAEIKRAARSAWGYQISGRNFVGGSGGFGCTRRLRQRIGDPDAFWLFATLMEAHFEKLASMMPFSVSVRAMVAAGTAAPMGEHRTRNALKRLVAVGVLGVVYQGGHGPGDPSRYMFGTLA